MVSQMRRMAHEASTRLVDADELNQSPRVGSDSGYLLELLAFEILLKAVARINGGQPKLNHSYLRLFEALPPEVRQRVIASAQGRMTTAAGYSNLPDLLENFSRNFVNLRYPYEKYGGMTMEETKALGQEWLANGAPLADATFVYHPQELYGLTVALQSEVQVWLDAKGP